MKYFVKLVHINDGNENEHHNGDRLLVESYPRSEKIIAAFLSDGWQLKERTQRVTPNILKEGSYGFFLGGWDLLFVKEARSGETDNGDSILEKALASLDDEDDEDDGGEDYDGPVLIPDDGDGDDADDADDELPTEVIPDDLRSLADELGVDLSALLDSDTDDDDDGDGDDDDNGGSDSDDGDDDLIAQMNRLLNI